MLDIFVYSLDCINQTVLLITPHFAGEANCTCSFCNDTTFPFCDSTDPHLLLNRNAPASTAML